MRRARGLGALAALVVLVLLALLAAAIVRLAQSGQTGFAQALQTARAQAAVRAGLDHGLYQVLKGGWSDCSTPQSQTLDLRTDSGMRVSVSCSMRRYNEGESSPGVAQQRRLYRLDAVACNGAAATCPDNAAAAGPNYVERMRSLTVVN